MRANEVDSQSCGRAAGGASGCRAVADPEQADAVVVNTCAFVEAAKRESIETVLDARLPLKEHGRARDGAGHRSAWPSGTPRAAGQLPEADAIVPLPTTVGFRELLGGSATPAQPRWSRRGGGRCRWCSRPRPGRRSRPGRPPRAGGLVKLAEGCDRDCSFCAIPSFRGRFRSRRPTEILDEVAWLAGQGVSEVCLVAENSTSYGRTWAAARP